MFTFQWSELLVIIIGGFVLFLGLAFLMLRRRNEILQRFLTPEEPDLEEEFFRVHTLKPKEIPPENAAEPDKEKVSKEDSVRWGTPAADSSPAVPTTSAPQS